MVDKFGKMFDGIGEMAYVAMDKAGDMVDDVMENFREDPMDKFN